MFHRNKKGQFKKSLIIVYEHYSLNPVDDGSEKGEVNRDGKPVTVKPSTANLRLVTNDSRNKVKETTTTEELVWPKSVRKEYKGSIMKIGVGLEHERIQEFLDEIEGSSTLVRNPVAYFRDLVKKYRSEAYIPSGSIAVKLKRQAAACAVDNLELMRQQSIQNGADFFAAHAKANLE
jgi:hypothetical protein